MQGVALFTVPSMHVARMSSRYSDAGHAPVPAGSFVQSSNRIADAAHAATTSVGPKPASKPPPPSPSSKVARGADGPRQVPHELPPWQAALPAGPPANIWDRLAATPISRTKYRSAASANGEPSKPPHAGGAKKQRRPVATKAPVAVGVVKKKAHRAASPSPAAAASRASAAASTSAGAAARTTDLQALRDLTGIHHTIQQLDRHMSAANKEPAAEHHGSPKVTNRLHPSYLL